MWQMLKGRMFGKRFRRQFIIGNYIADFACVEDKLVIEIDGGYHTDEMQRLHDEMRSEWLEDFGYQVIRFSNDEVIGHPEGVLQTIYNKLNFLTTKKKSSGNPSAWPPHKGGGGAERRRG